MSLSKILINNTQVATVDDEPIVDSSNLVTSGGITKVYGKYYQNNPEDVYVIISNNGRRLLKISQDGEVEFSGIPTDIKNHIDTEVQNINETLDNYVLKEEGKELIESGVIYTADEDSAMLLTDSKNKIILKIDKNGNIITYNNTNSDSSQSITVNISNSSKVGIFSTSFTNGYCMKNHHLINNLSMFSDYIFYNYGKSGSNPPETLDRINKNEKWLGDVAVQDWNIDYGISLFQENDAFLHSIDPKSYRSVIKKLSESIRNLGAVPVFATEHDVSYGSDLAFAIQQGVCNECGYTFINNIRTSNALYTRFFEPFWLSHHPATRTHWLWTNTLLPYINSLPRPKQGIKMFRARNARSITDIYDLMYNNINERAEKFIEIDCGVSALTKETEKYFDRLNQYGNRYEDLKDEYQKIQSKSDSVVFGTYALIECICPFDSKSITSFTLNVDAENVGKIYIKKNLSVQNYFTSERYIAFGVDDGIENLSVGDSFSISSGVFDTRLIGDYTITDIHEGIDRYFIVTDKVFAWQECSGTDQPVTTLQNVTLRGSYRSPSPEYYEKVNESLGDWIELDYNNGNINIDETLLRKSMDFDKVSFLLTSELLSDITLSDIHFNVSGGKQKEFIQKEMIVRKEGESLLTSIRLDDNSNWDNINNVEKYVPVIDPVNSVAEQLPHGVDVVRVLYEGDKISQSINTSLIDSSWWITNKIQIRVVARYFPLYVDSDENWNNSEITEESFDCAEMSINIQNYPVATFKVGAYWNEYISNIDYFWGDKLYIECTDKKIQIAKVELVKI